MNFDSARLRQLYLQLLYTFSLFKADGFITILSIIFVRFNSPTHPSPLLPAPIPFCVSTPPLPNPFPPPPSPYISLGHIPQAQQLVLDGRENAPIAILYVGSELVSVFYFYFAYVIVRYEKKQAFPLVWLLTIVGLAAPSVSLWMAWRALPSHSPPSPPSLIPLFAHSLPPQSLP